MTRNCTCMKSRLLIVSRINEKKFIFADEEGEKRHEEKLCLS
jgi:hypothetical protein